MKDKALNFEGKEYPASQFIIYEEKLFARVSSVLKPFVDFSGIKQETLDRKALIGTAVHDAIDEDIQGNLPVVNLNAHGYFQSFEKWRRAVNPCFLKTEVRHYCSKKMITGRIDAIIKLDGEEKGILVDWKTAANESAVTWAMQSHLYHYLLARNGSIVSDRFLFVKLDKDGGLPKVFTYKFNTYTEQKCFQAIEDFWAKWK